MRRRAFKLGAVSDPSRPDSGFPLDVRRFEAWPLDSALHATIGSRGFFLCFSWLSGYRFSPSVKLPISRLYGAVRDIFSHPWFPDELEVFKRPSQSEVEAFLYGARIA